MPDYNEPLKALWKFSHTRPVGGLKGRKQAAQREGNAKKESKADRVASYGDTASLKALKTLHVQRSAKSQGGDDNRRNNPHEGLKRRLPLSHILPEVKLRSDGGFILSP